MATQPVGALAEIAAGDEVFIAIGTPIGTVKQTLADRFEVAATDEDIWISNAAIQSVSAGRVTLACGLESLSEYILADASPSPLRRDVRA